MFNIFSDGRSIIDTVGGRRFRVLERGTRDGYNTAKVEFIQDEEPKDDILSSKLMQLIFWKRKSCGGGGGNKSNESSYSNTEFYCISTIFGKSWEKATNLTYLHIRKQILLQFLKNFGKRQRL